MGIFDRVRRAFRGKAASAQPDEAKTVDAVSVPEQVPISPLPQSIRRMKKGRDVDRLGMMKAEHIGFAPSFGPEQKGFWEYKEQGTNGYSKADYLEMASHIPEVRERLNNGESLQSLMHDKRVGACATQYFSPEKMIMIESHPDGHYEYSTGGRHRIAAAQELGIEIPVQINEFGNKDGYSISPWEKQERYDALMDYMKEHNYSESDRAVYETDPEWQKLSKDFNHPVHDWERRELSDWEKSADSLLSQRYEEMRAAKGNDAHDAIMESTTSPGSPQNDSARSHSQEATVNNRYQSAYEDRIRQTPSLTSKRWAGERGESFCAPQSDAARQILEERGMSGVAYQNGVPDFSPFSESTVKLGYMTDSRHSSGLVNGRDSKNTVYAHFEDGELISESHRADKGSMADLHMKYDKPGNFEQADVLAAAQWTAEGKDGKSWTAKDVAQYRKDNGLTWHECNDRETMQMIPNAINADFGHLGGVAEVKETNRIIDEVLSKEDGEQWIEENDINQMSDEELAALSRKNGHYDEEGIWIPDEVEEQSEPLVDRPEDVTEEVLPEEESAEAFSEAPIDEPIENPIVAPDEGPIDAPVDASDEESVDTPVDVPDEEPVDTPVDVPDEESVDAPVETLDEEPVDAPVDVPDEEPVDAPVDAPDEEPVDSPVDAPDEEPVDAPVETLDEEPVDAPVETPDESLADEFSDDNMLADVPDSSEDFSDLSDEAIEMSDEASEPCVDLSDEGVVFEDEMCEDYSDLSDNTSDDLEDAVDAPMDASDFSDFDSESYDDGSFDPGDVSVDSGNVGSFDGGDSID